MINTYIKVLDKIMVQNLENIDRNRFELARTYASSENTSSKIFLIGANTQTLETKTYSHDTVYVDSTGHLTTKTPAATDNSKRAATTEFLKTKITNNEFVADIKASLQPANHGNWLLCNGQAVSRTDYSELFAVIGINFGAGDGSTTFNVPDYRGKFLRGLGGDSAADFYTTQVEGLPNITGILGPSRTLHTYSGTSIDTSGAFKKTSISELRTIGTGFDSDNIYKYEFDASRSNAIYGASNHVTPINQAVNYFIRAKVY